MLTCQQRFWEGVSLALCTNVGQVFTETQISGLKLDLMTYYPILLSTIPQTQGEQQAIDFFIQVPRNHSKIKAYAILMAHKWSIKCQLVAGYHKLLLMPIFILICIICIIFCEQSDCYYQPYTRSVFSDFDKSISTLKTPRSFSFVLFCQKEILIPPKRDFNG